METIVITGGLGYIGTELCKLYSGESRYKKIIIIDNKFRSKSVKQLRDWGMEFIQGDILDEDLMRETLIDADIIHHLAGITNVAYTRTEEDREYDQNVRRVGVEGTRNIIKYSNDKCKIIFPSSHVVYEGFSETKFELTEDIEPRPVLTYSKGKVDSENDLKNSGKKFVILRLGSNYGLSEDSTRINIMPNLFSKIASQNGTIKLFSGGIQYKSLVSVFDVARCFKYMAEKNEIINEIFHVSSENKTVREVAEICKEINPRVKIIETSEEIPNLGYTLSNKKLLDKGFEFRYDLRTCIKEMIREWSKKNLKKELEYKIRGDKEYVDHRGKISNYELTEPINLIGYIDSKKGSLRANHYHPIQEQKVLLIGGEYISVYKDLAETNAEINTQLVTARNLVVTKPNVAHAMVFTKDSVLLNLVRGEREHENYGITHTIPYELVDDALRDFLLNHYKKECRSCNNIELKKIISLGLSPLANNLLSSIDEEYEKYPLEMNYCPRCHNVQLSCVVPPQKMFDEYLYVSSTAASFRDHFKNAATKYVQKYNLGRDSLVIDIGSNDGIALIPFKEFGIPVLGIEPAKNIAKIANDKGIETWNEYFTDETVSKILSTKGKADLITASNVFAHADDLKGMTKNVFNCLKKNGTFIIEVQYLLDTIKDLTFDNIYHEHVNYWSVTSLNNFFKSMGLTISDVEHIETHGGSIRVYVQDSPERISKSVENFLEREKDFGLLDFRTYENFGNKIREAKKNVNENIRLLEKNGQVIGYGAPAKATTALNYYGINKDNISFIVEDNALKHNKIMPGTMIPITSKENIPKNSKIIVLAWNFFDEIKKNNKDLIDKGVEFISIRDLQKKDFIK